MAEVDGRLYFAPGILMRDLVLDDAKMLLSAFEHRIRGLFLSPIRTLEYESKNEAGALFAAALLVAALVESVARVETGSDAKGTLIRQWLEEHVPAFKEIVQLGPGRGGAPQATSLADVFESRFRNGLAHNGYVASLGRLSRSIGAPVTVVGGIVIVNPFIVADHVERWLVEFSEELHDGRRDIRRVGYQVAQQFRDEVERAKAEASGG